MIKRLLASPFMQTLVGRLLGLYMLLVGHTTRWTYVDRAIAERIWEAGGPVVICFWHGRIVLSYWGWTVARNAQKAKVLISHSREGGIVAAATQTVGAGVIRGSSAKGDKRKGAIEATRAMLRMLAGGGAIGIAPDGPRGPRMHAQPGPVQLAKRTGAPIICLGWAVRGAKVFNSWDRFVLPGLFSRGVYVWGGPLYVARDADDAAMETARAALEAELNRVTIEAERRAGVAHVEPAPRGEHAAAT